MKIQTQYTYEKNWTTTSEDDLIKIIKEEIGDYDPQGTLSYIKEKLKKSNVITVGNCRFKKEKM